MKYLPQLTPCIFSALSSLRHHIRLLQYALEQINLKQQSSLQLECQHPTDTEREVEKDKDKKSVWGEKKMRGGEGRGQENNQNTLGARSK